jgi:hypothetical protein
VVQAQEGEQARAAVVTPLPSTRTAPNRVTASCCVFLLGLATVRAVRSRRTDGSLPAYGRDRDLPCAAFTEHGRFAR